MLLHEGHLERERERNKTHFKLTNQTPQTEPKSVEHLQWF